MPLNHAALVRTLVIGLLAASTTNTFARPVVLQACLPKQPITAPPKTGGLVPGCEKSISFGVDGIKEAADGDYRSLRLRVADSDRPKFDRFIADHNMKLIWLLRSRRFLQATMLTSGSVTHVEVYFYSPSDEETVWRLLAE